jgi:hypothetical protein
LINYASGARQGNRSKAIASVPAASLGPCEKGFNTKVAKIAKITKQVIECASREAPYSPFFVILAILATFVLNLANRDWSRTVDRARPAQRSSDCPATVVSVS